MSVADIAIAKPVVAGGQAVRKTPFAPWPFFGPAEIEAAAAVLQSGKVNYWTGQEGRLFEKEFAAAAGCQYAVALANGSLALELALYVLGIQPGDEVIVPSRTFVASASCVAVRGATPVFADVDRDSQNITAESIRRVLSPRTKAIIVVHLAGWPCDMDPILESGPPARFEGDRGLRPGPGRDLQRPAHRFDGRCSRVFLLPGQDHDHLRRRWNADHQRSPSVADGLELQRSRQKLRRHDRGCSPRPHSAGCTTALAPTGE